MTLDLSWLGAADETQYRLVLNPLAHLPDRVHLVLAPSVSRATTDKLVHGLPESQHLGFFDGDFPGTPNDPGAYFELQHRDGQCYISAGNHGWSSEWRPFDSALTAQYLWGCRRSNMSVEECLKLEPAYPKLHRVGSDPDSPFARHLAARLRQIGRQAQVPEDGSA